MTYFEFVSIAISLIFAFAITDILRALIPAAGSARYWPHFLSLINGLLLVSYVWLAYWNFRHLTWSGLFFIHVLVNPALLTVMARLLTTANPEAVTSFRDHFLRSKRALFLVLIAFNLNGLTFAWVTGQREFGTFSPQSFGALVALPILAMGLMVRSDRAIGSITVAITLVLLALLALEAGQVGSSV